MAKNLQDFLKFYSKLQFLIIYKTRLGIMKLQYNFQSYYLHNTSVT